MQPLSFLSIDQNGTAEGRIQKRSDVTKSFGLGFSMGDLDVKVFNV
jgi:hypothetical protein